VILTRCFHLRNYRNSGKRFSLFGLTMLPAITKICLSDSDEVNDLAEVAESGREISDAFTKAVKSTEEFGKRTPPIIKLAINKGFM
jgi:hypothetical protein